MKRLRLFLVSLLTLALIAGCSSKPSGNSTTGNATGDSSLIKVATDTDLMTMDHHIATDGTSFVAQSMVFSGLVALDEKNMPVAELAEKWEISPDGTVYTFHLVDATWDNGTAVTAKDFVYGWQRLAKPETASQYSFILSTIQLKNAEAVSTGELPLEELGIKAIDDKTLEVTLDAPCDFLLGLMAFPPFFPLNEEFYTSQGDQYALTPANLLSCGPYKLNSWTAGNGYSFIKNDSYFKADTIKTKQVDFRFIQDTQSAMLEYQSGNLDVVRLSGEMVDAYKNEPGYTNRLTGYLWYLSINCTNDKFQNVDLRMAMSYAVDRETIVKSVLKDGSVAAQGIIPIEFTTGPDGKDFRETAGNLLSYDPAKAAEYYAKAKAALGGDISLDLLFEDTEASKSVAEYVQNNLETNCPGMKVTLNSKPKKARLDLMKVQNYDIGLHRWGPDYADPQTYMDLFLSDNLDNNYGRFNSAAYDSLVKEATRGTTAADSQARWNMLMEAEKALMEEQGVVPIYQNGGAYMINPKVSGIEFHSAGVDSYRTMVKE